MQNQPQHMQQMGHMMQPPQSQQMQHHQQIPPHMLQQQQQQQQQQMMQQQQQQQQQGQMNMGGGGVPMNPQQVHNMQQQMHMQQQQQQMQNQMMAQQQQQLNQQQQQAGAAAAAAAAETNYAHPANRVKLLFVELKQSLATVMRLAAENVKVEASAAETSNAEVKAVESSNQVEELRKAYDNFMSICDQMEECFVLMQEAERQSIYSNLFMPVNVNYQRSIDKDDPHPMNPASKNTTLPQFNTMVKRQVEYSKIVHRTLSDFVQKLQP